MKVLLAGGANPRLTGPAGKTALAGALERRLRGEGAPGERTAGNARTLDIVKLLVDQHIDLNAVDHEDGNAPLHIAASRGLTAIAQYLVENGADLHLTNYSNETPLATATAAGRRGAAAAELLTKLGAKY